MASEPLQEPLSPSKSAGLQWVAASSGKTFQSILDANKGVGPGFDALRILLALAIFWGHAKAIAGGHAIHYVDQLAHYVAGNWEGPRRPLQVAYIPAFFAVSGFLGVWSQGIVVQYTTSSKGINCGTDSSRQRHDD